jgi:hypothetical protein
VTEDKKALDHQENSKHLPIFFYFLKLLSLPSFFLCFSSTIFLIILLTVSTSDAAPRLSEVKLFGTQFFTRLCTELKNDGWQPLTLATLGKLDEQKSKCLKCRKFFRVFSKSCQSKGSEKRAESKKIEKKELEPSVPFLSFITDVLHDEFGKIASKTQKSKLSAEELRSFLMFISNAYQQGEQAGKSYFGILDAFAGPPVILMLGKIKSQESAHL